MLFILVKKKKKKKKFSKRVVTLISLLIRGGLGSIVHRRNQDKKTPSIMAISQKALD